MMNTEETSQELPLTTNTVYTANKLYDIVKGYPKTQIHKDMKKHLGTILQCLTLGKALVLNCSFK